MTIIEILAFLGFVIVLSLSGVLMPGPMTAATIAKSYSDRWAGAKVALGHAIVESPLIILIALGTGVVLETDDSLIIAIGLIGGIYLVYFGWILLRDEGFIEETPDTETLSKNSVVLGITTTLFNPGFILWWFAIGSFIVVQALEISVLMLVIVGVIHWSCDFCWGIMLSFGIQRAKQFYASKMKNIIRYGCAALILVFGSYFIISSIAGLLT